MQHHAADELHIEMALAKRAFGRLAHCGEGLRDQLIERRSSLDTGAECLRAGAELLVGECCHPGLQRIDRRNLGVLLELALVGGPEDLAGEGAEGKHEPSLLSHELVGRRCERRVLA